MTTASEQRLHPASILFDMARYARVFVWPALAAFVTGQRGRPGPGDPFDISSLEVWLLVLVLPSVGLSIARYLTFRIRYEPTELVVRSGLVFRHVRHIPYARIQNLDAVQNPFHRLLGVAEIRVETGSGHGEPEARMRVLPLAALDVMRARVFAGRTAPEAAAAIPAGAPEAEEQLLRLSLADLLLLGFIENRGMVIVGAAYGTLWEMGLMDRVWSALFTDTLDARGLAREVLLFAIGRGPLPFERLALALAGLAGFLVLVRLLSMAWAVLRLYDFRLTRQGEDLHIVYGLLTRVTATIPLRRVQTLTIRRRWLHRRFGRATIRIETAGGPAGTATRDREWVAPLVADASVGAILAGMLPGVAFHDEGDGWAPVHARAFRRAVKPALFLALTMSAALLACIGWRALVIGLPLAAWAVVATRLHVRSLRWQASDELVAFRSGWLSTARTLVRVNRIQAIALRESPFDRRARMASILVDTAGAGELSHRVAIPYLDAAVAASLQQRLARAVARTRFRW